jgi:hypothetical protein
VSVGEVVLHEGLDEFIETVKVMPELFDSVVVLSVSVVV